MELHINDVAARTNAGDWLQQCRDGFLESLTVQGYSPATIDVYGRFVAGPVFGAHSPRS